MQDPNARDQERLKSELAEFVEALKMWYATHDHSLWVPVEKEVEG